MRSKHFGKPKSYPYFFIAKVGEKKHDIFISGVYKTKKLAKERAEEYSGKGRYKHPYTYRVIDRRTKKRKRK